MIREIYLSTKLRHGLHSVLPQSDGNIHLLKRSHDGGNDKMEILFEGGAKDSERMKYFGERVLSTRFEEVVVKRFEHEGEKIGEVRLELGVECDGDTLDHVDDDHLQPRVDGGDPKVADGVHDGAKMVPNVLLDHRNELSKILEIVLLQTDGAGFHHRQESRDDLKSVHQHCATAGGRHRPEAGK